MTLHILARGPACEVARDTARFQPSSVYHGPRRETFYFVIYWLIRLPLFLIVFILIQPFYSFMYAFHFCLFPFPFPFWVICSSSPWKSFWWPTSSLKLYSFEWVELENGKLQTEDWVTETGKQRTRMTFRRQRKPLRHLESQVCPCGKSPKRSLLGMILANDRIPSWEVSGFEYFLKIFCRIWWIFCVFGRFWQIFSGKTVLPRLWKLSLGGGTRHRWGIHGA